MQTSALCLLQGAGDDAQQGECGTPLDAVEHDVRGVAAHETEVGAAMAQVLGRIAEIGFDRGVVLPVEHGEHAVHVDAPDADLGQYRGAVFRLLDARDDCPVVAHRRFGADAADDAHVFHVATVPVVCIVSGMLRCTGYIR